MGHRRAPGVQDGPRSPEATLYINGQQQPSASRAETGRLVLGISTNMGGACYVMQVTTIQLRECYESWWVASGIEDQSVRAANLSAALENGPGVVDAYLGPR
jgi:hypothetical protein